MTRRGRPRADSISGRAVTDTVKRKRGRPCSGAATVSHDEKIAQAAHRLVMWGFAGDRVFDALLRAAKEILNRTDSDGNKLGPDRIEQIYKRWLKGQLYVRSFERYQKTGQIGDVSPIFSERWVFKRDGLIRRAPPGSIDSLACKLLKGWRPRSMLGKSGYVSVPEFSERREKQLETSPLKRPENRVIKSREKR